MSALRARTPVPAPAAVPGPRRRRALPAWIALLGALSGPLAGCAGQDGSAAGAGAAGAVAPSASALAQIQIVFTRDERGTHLAAEGHFARFRPGELARTTTLLGLGHEGALALDACTVVDVGDELDRAFSGGPSADVDLLDAGRLLVKGPLDAAQLLPRRYPDLTPEVTGVVYSAERAALTLEPGAAYEVVAEGGEEVGPFTATVPAPRAFPSLEGPVLVRGGDLELRWQAAGTVSDPMLLHVVWTARTGARELRCRVRDDGAFAVPRALLSSLPPLAEAHAEVTVTRQRRSPLQAPGLGRGELVIGLREVAPLREE